MTQLTTFQVETEEALRQKLAAVGATLDDRKVSGKDESYVEGKVRDVGIWIYADEACVIGRGVDRVFEKWDFDSPEELRNAFISQVLNLL